MVSFLRSVNVLLAPVFCCAWYSLVPSSGLVGAKRSQWWAAASNFFRSTMARRSRSSASQWVLRCHWDVEVVVLTIPYLGMAKARCRDDLNLSKMNILKVLPQCPEMPIFPIRSRWQKTEVNSEPDTPDTPDTCTKIATMKSVLLQQPAWSR